MQTDVILEQILEQAKLSNGTLALIKEQLVKNAGNNGSGSGPGGNPPSPPPGANRNQGPSIDFKRIFKDFGKSFAPLASSSADSSTLINSVGQAASSAADSLQSIPNPVAQAAGMFLRVVSTGSKLYDYLEGQLKLYQDLNNAGLSLQTGIFGVKSSAADAHLSLDGLSKVLMSNTDSFAAMDDMYGDGIQHFGNLVNTVTMAQKQIGAYGLSQQQIANITAKNFKLDKLYGSNSQMRDLQEQQSSQSYIRTLLDMSKVLGTSVDTLLKKNEAFSESYEGFAIDTVLDRLLPPDLSKKTSKEFGVFTAGLGEAGENIQHIMSEYLTTGRLPKDVGQWGRSLMPFFDNMYKAIKSGNFNPKDFEKELKRLSKDPSQLAAMQDDIQAAQQTSNAAGAKILTSFRNVSVLLNQNAGQTEDSFTTLMTRFDNWMGDSITKPMLKFFSDTANTLSDSIMKIYDSTGSKWEVAESLFLTGIGKVFDWITYLPTKLTGLLIGQENAEEIREAVKSIFTNITSVFQRSGKIVWDMFFGTEDDLKRDGKMIHEAINNIVQGVKDWFNKIKNLIKNLSFTGIKDSISDWGKEASDSVSKKWESFKKGFKGDTTETQQPSSPKNQKANGPSSTEKKVKPVAPVKPVKVKPEYTNPAKIDKSDDKEQDPNANGPVQPTQAELDIQNILNNLASVGNAQLGALNNAVKALNNINSNTQPVNNA